jgi:hypothetical protein
MIDHKDHDHPSTPKARAACRKANGVKTGEGSTSRASSLKKIADRPSRGKGKRRQQLEEQIAANAKRSAEEVRASQILNGALECHVCGKKATWHDGQTGEPACSKHVTFLAKEETK